MIAEQARSYALPKDACYGVLFDVNHWQSFAESVRARDDLKSVFIVTDSLAQYQQIVAELPTNIEVSMLYEDYLRNFEINVGGAL
jgi:hypothetical protein